MVYFKICYVLDTRAKLSARRKPLADCNQIRNRSDDVSEISVKNVSVRNLTLTEIEKSESLWIIAAQKDFMNA